MWSVYKMSVFRVGLSQPLSLFMLVQDGEMLDMQSTDATTTGCDSLARIDMNNSGTRQARAVQSGLKESPIAMGQSRDNNAMNPSRISRRF